MVKNLMMSAKMTPSDLLKIKVFWIKGYCAIYSVYDVNNKILSHEPNIADVVMWPEFGNSSICIREVIITLIYKDLIRKNTFWGEGGGGGLGWSSIIGDWH